MNIQEEIRKTKKGCGKIVVNASNAEMKCGYDYGDELKGLCSICQERLKTLKECEKMIKELTKTCGQEINRAIVRTANLKDIEWKKKIDDFYNEFDLASNCTKDDKLFKKLWNKYFKGDKDGK